MIAKYDGKCKVTGKTITAGLTNIEKINGIWQVATKKQNVPHGATISLAWSEVYQDRYGDEYLKHFYSFGNDDGEPVGSIWSVSSPEAAERYAIELLETYGLADCVVDTLF